MAYAVFLRPAGLRDLQNLSPNLRERVESAIDALAENPRPPGCKKLVGFEDEWRVAHRREAYR